MMRPLTVILTFAAVFALPALADPIDGATARDQLFKPTPSAAQTVPQAFLSEAEMAIVAQVAATQAYYGAMAVAPGDGLMSNATVAAANYHDLEQARVAALTSCNARREKAEACVIVAEIVPKGHEPRAFQLSSAATEAFNKDYKRGRGPKAMAISASTGQWAVVKAEDAAAQAVADCAAAAQATDCVVAVQD